MELTYDYKDRLIIAEDAGMRAEYTYYYSGQRALKKVWHKGDGPWRACESGSYCAVYQ